MSSACPYPFHQIQGAIHAADSDHAVPPVPRTRRRSTIVIKNGPIASNQTLPATWRCGIIYYESRGVLGHARNGHVERCPCQGT